VEEEDREDEEERRSWGVKVEEWSEGGALLGDARADGERHREDGEERRDTGPMAAMVRGKALESSDPETTGRRTTCGHKGTCGEAQGESLGEASAGVWRTHTHNCCCYDMRYSGARGRDGAAEVEGWSTSSG